MSTAKRFGGKLRELRERKGWTQEQLADKIGVKREAIARWESGSREPRWSYVLTLADVLSATCQDFAEESVPRASHGPGRPVKRKSPPARETA